MKDGTGELAAQMSGMQSRIMTLVEVAKRLYACDTLDAGTYVFDTSGVIERDYQAPFGAVMIVNRSASSITAEAGTTRGTPGATHRSGPGIWDQDANESLCMNVAGRALTIYGTAGDRVTLQVYARPQPPHRAR